MKKNDVILISIIVCVSIILFGVNVMTKHTGDTVVIYVNGEVYETLPLKENTTVNINNTNTIKIENGEVFMENATCPDHLCVNQGKISDNKKNIVCLPNKVVVKVLNKGDVDVVTR